MSKSLVTHIITNNYRLDIKHSNTYNYKNNKIHRAWIHFNSFEYPSYDNIIDSVILCRTYHPYDDILLQAYDKETEILEVHQILEQNLNFTDY